MDGGLLGIGLIGASAQNTAHLGQTCSRGEGVDATSCWPPTSSGAPSKTGALNGWGYYSPGVHCPVGYATACRATGGSGGGSEWPVQFRLRAGETAVGCCPRYYPSSVALYDVLTSHSGYGCANINGQTCTMIATSTTVPTVTCDGTKSGDFAFQTVPDAEASITAFSLFAPMIQINWQSSDQPATTTRSRTSGDSPTRTSTPDQPTATSGTQTIDTKTASDVPTLVTDGSVSLPTNTGNSNASTGDAEQKGAESDGNTGLATTTKVGLSIAGAVAAVALVVGTVMYVWRRRRNQREEQELDRLYGMKHNSSTNLNGHGDDDIPGWYRGQRQVATQFTPAASQFTPTTLSPYGPGAGSSELDAPASPYYRPYRP